MYRLNNIWLTELTNINDVRIEGAHLELPGFEQQGPTLEIFSFDPVIERKSQDPINRLGFGHLAFQVEDVEAYVERIKRAGGGILGSVVEKDYGDMGTLSVAYCLDPEGNFIEIQNWSL
jgi:catechol 2,3-dioxygenase-like lactoylglutathione lyase family enzyme